MDRNTVIGFVLLAVLLFLYLFLSTKSTHELQARQQREADSLALVKRTQDSIAALKDTAARMPVAADSMAGGFQKGGAPVYLDVSNEVFSIRFSNIGGQPAKVTLKNYKSYDSLPVVLGGTDFDKISYTINAGNNHSVEVGQLRFQPGTVQHNPDGSQTVLFTALGEHGESIEHRFLIRKDDYMVDWTIRLNGADQLLTQGAVNFQWQSQPVRQEKDLAYERQQTDICYLEDNDFDYIRSKAERKLEKPVEWVSVAQQFFNSTLVAGKGFSFSSGDIQFKRDNNDSSRYIAQVTTSLHAQVPMAAAANIPLQLYYGPNDYNILKKEAAQMDKIVNLGRDLYAFVRPVNKYIVMPVFDFFRSFIGSLGLVIALLTIFIRLATSPLVYSSYLSGAKMKALRPEIAKLKEKFGNNQQQIGMEQMKLFREAGVNPLGGCIPALLQIPIFFALYSFFNSTIALRGQSFLWAHNLASYDSIIHFNFNIWGLGNHLSLFTLTAAATSFLISIYNQSMTPTDPNNPALKYMPYIFPFMLLFIFNRLPSALTWYYTVSNVITLILQFVIQNYIIDHDKILAGIEENRKKPKSKNKFQERLEQMQEAQKKMQEARTKGK